MYSASGNHDIMDFAYAILAHGCDQVFIHSFIISFIQNYFVKVEVAHVLKGGGSELIFGWFA